MTRLLDRLREAERQRVRDHHGAGVYAWGIFGRDLTSAPDWLWDSGEGNSRPSSATATASSSTAPRRWCVCWTRRRN